MTYWYYYCTAADCCYVALRHSPAAVDLRNVNGARTPEAEGWNRGNVNSKTIPQSPIATPHSSCPFIHSSVFFDSLLLILSAGSADIPFLGSLDFRPTSQETSFSYRWIGNHTRPALGRHWKPPLTRPFRLPSCILAYLIILKMCSGSC